MHKINVMDAHRNEQGRLATIQRYRIDMNTLEDDIDSRIAALMEPNPVGYHYFNPAVTVFCPNPLAEFIDTVWNEQEHWCRQAANTFPRRIRRHTSSCVRGGGWVSNKYGRHLIHALCFTGVLFIDGQTIPQHEWPLPEAATNNH